MKERKRTLFLLCVGVLMLGLLIWIIPSEKTLKSTNAHADELMRAALTDERALNDEPRIQLLAEHIREDLRGLRLRPAAGDMSQALLGDLQATAARDRLAVVAVKPVVADLPPTLPHPDSRASSEPVEPFQESDVSVRGSYRDIVYFVEDLSHMPTLARVLSVQLQRASDDSALGQTPLLDATIHVRAIRLDHTIIP